MLAPFLLVVDYDYNPGTGMAKQVALKGTDYPVQFHFARSPKAEPCPSESVNVGA